MLKKLLIPNSNNKWMIMINIGQCLLLSIIVNIIYIVIESSNWLSTLYIELRYTMMFYLIIPLLFLIRGIYIIIKQLKLKLLSFYNQALNILVTIVIIPFIGLVSLFIILITFLANAGEVF